MMTLAVCIGAFILDVLLGDPVNWPHPIRWIGKIIRRSETILRRWFTSPTQLYVAGGLQWVIVVGTSAAATWCVIWAAFQIHWIVGIAVQLWLAFTVLAGKCLKDCALEVLDPLRRGDIAEARIKLSYIVGRDTRSLDQDQITRATVETVAENTVDGIIAPLFYLFIGGVPLAMAYKAVNTLDSMVGYKNQCYREFGCVSARIDDAANFIPARLTWLLFSAAAWLLKQDYQAAFLIGWRDRYQHKSPNCAWSEAAVAGALGIRLGGPNQYFGEWVDKPWIGEGKRMIEVRDIVRSVHLMQAAAWLALGLFIGVYLIG